MQYQFIVNITQVGIAQGSTKRAFNWVSATGSSLPEIQVSLRKAALRDMNFSIDEAELMSVHVLKAFKTQYKAVTVQFNNTELMTITIMDEDDIAAREREVFNLMMSTRPALERGMMN